MSGRDHVIGGGGYDVIEFDIDSALVQAIIKDIPGMKRLVNSIREDLEFAKRNDLKLKSYLTVRIQVVLGEKYK